MSTKVMTKGEPVSPIMSSKATAKHLKKSDIKQLSTASENMLVYDIARPSTSKQPLSVKNCQSFNSKDANKVAATNIRVKTPNEASMIASQKGSIIKNSGSGNRANLFNKYLRATDISNSKRLS